MEVKKPNENTLEIIGNIKSIDDYSRIKSEIDVIVNAGQKEIHLKLLDSFSLTSSVIGYLIKTINLNKITLHTYVNDERLDKLLASLNLSTMFNVKSL